MNLMHYAHAEVPDLLEDRSQFDDKGQPITFKPRGLWVSVTGPDDWRSWCEAESFNTGWSHVYDVTLSPDANILHLTFASDLDRFTRDYGREGSYRDMEIAWHEVAELYDGLIIAPYQWTRRMDLMWYYSWDCASGCIWNVNAIGSLSRRKVA